MYKGNFNIRKKISATKERQQSVMGVQKLILTAGGIWLGLERKA